MENKKLDKLMALYERESEQEEMHSKMKLSIWEQIQAILNEEEFIRPVDAAKILDVSPQTITNWVRAGVFRPEEYKKISAHTYVVSKRVIREADFFERRKELGRAEQ